MLRQSIKAQSKMPYSSAEVMVETNMHEHTNGMDIVTFKGSSTCPDLNDSCLEVGPLRRCGMGRTLNRAVQLVADGRITCSALRMDAAGQGSRPISSPTRRMGEGDYYAGLIKRERKFRGQRETAMIQNLEERRPCVCWILEVSTALLLVDT